MQSAYSVDDLILNYDPESPPERFRQAGLPAALKSSTGRLPGPVPWPQGHAPSAAPLPQPPAESNDFGRFHGYDAVVVTWTAAEAAALAALFTPDYLPSRWYEYRHNVVDYVPLVTGFRAPFNDRAADMARYYHSLGLYFPCLVGTARVLLFKSGLHLAYDGPATPVRRLMVEIAQTVQPKVMITTGTAGAIGADVLLGDVVIAAHTRFDCTTQFKKEPWAQESYQTSTLPPGALVAITPDLTRVNASRIPGARSQPKVWTGDQQATVVTTDLFAFDDSTDFYNCRASAARATWATRWSAMRCRPVRGLIGMRCGMLPIRRSRTPTATSRKPTKKPARSMPNGVRSQPRRAPSLPGPSSTRGSIASERRHRS